METAQPHPLPQAGVQPPIPTSPPPPQSPYPSPVSGTPKEPSHLSPYLLALLTFIVGVGLGYLLIKYFPSNTEQKTPEKVEIGEITLPEEATEVASCINRKGALFIKPQDIPKGPLYLVHNEKVIGLEYVLDQAEFENENIYSFLPSLDIHVNHMQVTHVTQSYDGKEGSFNIVDLYLVPKEEADAISCPETVAEVEPEAASPSATLESEEPVASVTQGTAVGTTTPQAEPTISTTPESQ